MRLYDALTYLQDAGWGEEKISVYEKAGVCYMLSVDHALEEQSSLALKVSEWFDRPIIEEPHIDRGGRIVFCVGYVNGNHPEPEWDGFWDPEDLPFVYDDYVDFDLVEEDKDY